MLSKEQLDQITTYGQYYMPSILHYKHIPNAESIRCDMCDKQKILACIGYESYDLCLTCVENHLTNSIKEFPKEHLKEQVMPIRIVKKINSIKKN